jgi:hypothetical protein
LETGNRQRDIWPPPAGSASGGNGAAVRSSQAEWLRVRGYLSTRRHELTRAAQELYPPSLRLAGTPLLTRPGWCPAEPIPLDQVTVSWRPAGGDRGNSVGGMDDSGIAVAGLDDGGPNDSDIDSRGLASAAVRPLREAGRRFGRYADALSVLSRPGLFEDRFCYRLLDVRPAPAAADLGFGPGGYFDLISVAEAAAHEYAAATLATGNPGRLPQLAQLPLRSLIGDPTELRRRPVPAAVAVLMLRADRASGGHRMILHWRDPAMVASGGGLVQVAPVGIFQPSHDASWNRVNDFSLWRCIAREMSEELLGSSEDYHSATAPIDYQRWPFYVALADGRRAGLLRAYWLGLGIDPLTLAADMLAVAVFDAEFFDRVFSGLVAANAEGRLLASEDPADATAGVPFTAASVDRFTTAEPMQPAGAALLRSAWQHRHMLIAR